MARSLVEVNIRQLGIQPRTFGTPGWRTISRVVTVIGLDPDYEDVEIGTVRLNHKTFSVWKRLDQMKWTSNRQAVVRYAKMKAKEQNEI
jgi:hypothetical protein